MKRNMDLCRLILFKIEEEYKFTVLHNLNVDGYDLETVSYHCKLLWEAGLIDSYKSRYGNNIIYGFSVGLLTWEGHDFIDKIREDTFWKKTKEKIKDNALPMTIEVIKTVVTSLINQKLAGLFPDNPLI